MLSTEFLNRQITFWADHPFTWTHGKTSSFFLKIFRGDGSRIHRASGEEKSENSPMKAILVFAAVDSAVGPDPTVLSQPCGGTAGAPGTRGGTRLAVGPSRTQAHRQGCPLEETAGLLGLHIGVSGRFLIQHSNGTVVHGLRVCMRIANSGEPCSSQLAQGTHHVKHHASPSASGRSAGYAGLR
jgi:hypothetical protein